MKKSNGKGKYDNEFLQVGLKIAYYRKLRRISEEHWSGKSLNLPISLRPSDTV